MGSSSADAECVQTGLEVRPQKGMATFGEVVCLVLALLVRDNLKASNRTLCGGCVSINPIIFCCSRKAQFQVKARLWQG